MAVSWYGRSEEAYDDRGGRISFVDITDWSQGTLMYRQVPLVDENMLTFENIHVGGLAYQDRLIHVPDSKSGMRKVYTFQSITSSK